MTCIEAAALLLGGITGVSDPTIHPTTPTIPENILRFEIAVAHGMSRSPDMKSFRLRTGTELIEGALLDPPLLSGDGRWITIYLHPARIKTGLLANARLGRAITRGLRVTLDVVDRELGLELSRTWTVTQEDRSGPRPDQWKFKQPLAETCDPLVVKLDAPVSASAGPMIAIVDMAGQRRAGFAQLSENAEIWRFYPLHPWPVGQSFKLLAHPDVEDSAGNRACAAFDGERPTENICQQGSELTFQPRSPGVAN